MPKMNTMLKVYWISVKISFKKKKKTRLRKGNRDGDPE